MNNPKNTFAGIAEGITDQKVINNILVGYFNDRDINVNWLQPAKVGKNGGHGEVKNYCRSRKFKAVFDLNEYVIIHIDTDISSELGIPQQDENGQLISPEYLIEGVIDKFREIIGEDFYDQYAEKIIFALAVHTIECWLLPLHCQEARSATIDCHTILSKVFPEIKQGKDYKDYQKISMEYANNSSLLRLYPENPSLKIFIEQLASKNIEISEES
ncbi:phage tail protein [Pseudanabaena mucicola]|uniref:Phage tail protein n=1 Tax=Pseudanabaena mucicola FACHB-723 TaxID=2692860 RepID=A0ABR8A0U4_9CYAN|nr:phage tail protein [Pseudanabaena mucicola]MBD2189730.1 phage tail protein [Pseudanabaena mucicola FACHB-723]